MKPSPALNHSAKVSLSLTLLLVCPLLLPAQSKDKKSNPPPPPPQQQQSRQQQQQPPPQQQPRQQPPQQQQQPQHPANTQQNGGSRSGSVAGANTANSGRGLAPGANTANSGRGPTPGANTANGGRGLAPGANTANGGRGLAPGANTANGGRGLAPGANTANGGRGPVPGVNTANAGRGPTPKPPLSFKPPAGGKLVTTPAGHTQIQDPNGRVTGVFTKSGTEAHFTPAGKVSTIRTATGTTINNAPNGQRRIVTERRDANNRLESRVVTAGPNRGFVEHRFERGGHEYVRRTYVYEGRTNVTVYRTYYYNNVAYYHYVPAYYYAPVYYGWAYNPWPAPVYYTWGWYGDPWYRPYGYYFAPYAVYPSADFWLTDYLIAENLRASYQAQAAANADAAAANADAAAANANAAAANADTAASQRGSQAGAVTLTPEVKQMIAEEVKAQLAAEQTAAAQNATASGTPSSAPVQPAGNTEQVPPALDPNLRVFIVTTSLDVTAKGQTCSLSAGDVLRRMDNAPDGDNTVGVMVLSSQKSDCGLDSSPRVQVADLQEMHNRFREQLDNGLKTLADNQGKKGIPSGPAAGGRKNPDGAAAPDLTATTDLQKQKQDADQTEKEVQQATSSTSGTGGNN